MNRSIDDLLSDLRDNPADNSAATEDVLARVFKHLTSAPEDSAGRVHWFCDQASPTTVGAASFLLRLYGFNGESVNIWKAGFHRCISNCCFCVQQLEEVKVSSRSTFFGAYGEDILRRFFEKFEEWELELVLDDLRKAGLIAEEGSGKTLSDVSSTLLYRMVANWKVFSDARIQGLFHRCPPTRIVSDWPMKRPPPGLLVLLMANSKTLRDWARKQTLSCELSLLAAEQFTESYSQSLLAMAAVVSSPNYASTGSLLLSNEPPVVWAAFSAVLKLVPVEKLTGGIDIRHVVSGHLHDSGSHFADVLRSFILLLKRLAQKFWENADPGLPKIVFDSVKDNPVFPGLLQDLHQSSDNLWALSWMPELLFTIQETVAYGEVLAKMVDFLCEELQHERFEGARPIIMNSAVQLLTSVLRKCDSDKDFRHKDAFCNTLKIHSESIVVVAFRRDHGTESWKNARAAARSLVRSLLSSDIQRIYGTISATSRSLYQLKKGETPDRIVVLSVQKHLWTSTYKTIDGKDVGGLATVIVAIAKASFLAKLIKEPYRGIENLKVAPSDKGFVPGDQVIEQINDALDSVQTGFLDAVSKLTNFGSSASALEVLRQPNVGQAVIQLLLSPVSDFQTGAQSLIGLAFDEDARAECIKAMFVNLPEPTLEGIIAFLNHFNQYAAQAPEACSLSRSLVRCFNDILEALCQAPNGLLLDETFLRPEDPNGPSSRMLEFWKCLATALTTIFKRTAMWAPYYKPKEMVEWMRDAVILGRDLIARWRVIENAANGHTQSKPQKRHSGLRGKMIACFQDMLPELSKWLRLTDEELLYQSFSILQSLLEVFKETNTRPHEETLAKLTKYIKDARADGKAKSRLDRSSLSKLEDAMSPFLEDEDEVQIVDHVPAPKREKHPKVELAPMFRKDGKEKAKEKGKEKGTGQVKKEEPPKRNYIQVSSSKPSTAKSFQSKIVPDRRSSLNRPFSDAEKARLEAPAAFPTFKRSSTVATSSSTSTVKSTASTSRKGEIKNEALGSNSDESSDSSDSSDDEQQVGLSALGQLTKSPKIRKQERRQIKTLDIATGRSAIADRLNNRSKPTHHNPSLRLRPDISTLHKTILSWKYDHDGNLPPGNHLQLNQVPGEFTEYAHYRRVFEPLLLLECWAQIVRSKEEAPDGHIAKVSAKEYVSDWLDLDLAFTDNPPRDWDLSAETDIVLLSSPETKKSVMAKTLSYKKSPMGCVVRARCFLPGGSDPGLMQGSTWKVSKIYSLSTINREYGALVAAPYLQCFDRILSAKLERPPYIDSSEVQQAMTNLKLNKPQATAVVGAMKTEGFTLIQGPPGTGKTSTICGLVSRFISHRATPINVPERNDNPPKAKVLICAPSNAAIDEIASRLMNSTKKINVVRIGGESSIGSAVKPISLDQLINDKIQTKTGLQGLSAGETDREIKALLVEMDSLKHQREEKLKELTNFQDTLQKRTVLEGEAQKLRTRRQELGNKLTALRDKIKSENRSLDGLRRQMRREVLLESDVVCSTLSGAGHEVLIDQEFEMVIIDEAAQSIELSSLIPLKFNSTRCVLVGDPQQLPPTVISQEATRRRYDQSLFFRLFNKNPQAIHLLSIQYRMHPDISRFPSQTFYEGRIEDGPDMAQLTSRPWHTQPMFGTYKFFNVSGVEEPGAFNSIKNTSEVKIAKEIYSRLSREFHATGFKRRIGIVSMYRAQISELRRQFFQAFGESILESVDFNTVDGFQGQEKDIIILSCVRAGPGLQSIGFLADVRRLNVAITRAKSALFILGNAATLERSDETWKKVVTDARERNRLVTVDARFFQQSSTAVSGVASLSPTKPKAQPPAKKPRLSDSQPSQAPPSIPQDLVAPKDLKKLGRKPSGSNSIAGPSSSSLQPALQPVRPKLLPGPAPGPSVAGVKRPAEDEPGSRPGPSAPNRNADGPQTGPRPPPPKRPKPPQTMFIPKKPGKK